MTTKRSMKQDEKAVSPVIAVIMLIAITVVIAAVVAAFAYGIIGGVTRAPSSAFVVEGAIVGDEMTNVTIIHHGGDKILEAFDTGDNNNPWHDLEVRYNGAPINISDTTMVNVSAILLNGQNMTKAADAVFNAGDELQLTFEDGLDPGDSITVVYTPTEDIMQRIVVR